MSFAVKQLNNWFADICNLEVEEARKKYEEAERVFQSLSRTRGVCDLSISPIKVCFIGQGKWVFNVYCDYEFLVNQNTKGLSVTQWMRKMYDVGIIVECLEKVDLIPDDVHFIIKGI